MQHLRWLLLTGLPRYSKVSWGAGSRLHVFAILIKNFHEKCCTNNSLLSRDKTIASLLELIGHVLLISEYVFKKTLTAFDFDEKLTQSVAQVTT